MGHPICGVGGFLKRSGLLRCVVLLFGLDDMKGGAGGEEKPLPRARVCLESFSRRFSLRK
jgi:hypothetical protein